MNKRKSALGRGLATILGNHKSNKVDENPISKSEIIGKTYNILISNIQTNPFQPRNHFEKEKLHELASSIEKLGIIQPITVRKLDLNNYQLIAGERRLRASQLAGKIKIPAYVRIANDQQMLEIALVENIQRANLNPIEIALAYRRLIDECKLTQEACSERVGKNRSTITNFLRLLKLPEKIQIGLKQKLISTGHARALINIQNQNNQLNIYHSIITDGLSVREVEQIARTFSARKYEKVIKKKSTRIDHTISFNQKKSLYELAKKLECKIEIIQKKNGNGRIIIPFKSDKELTSIFNKISD